MTSAIDPNIIVTGSPVSKSAMKTQLTTAASEITELQSRTGRRNRIINGGMLIDQRNGGNTQTITGPSGVIFTVDRWIVQPTGASVIGQQVAGPSGHQFAYQISGAAGVTAVNLQQRIESVNCADLVNQNVTLSANISNSLLTTVTWVAYYATSADNWTSAVQIATGSWTVSSTATNYSATFNLGANAAKGVLIQLIVGAQTSGNWKVTGVQLEPGTVATPFERLSSSEIIAQCQRYYLGYGLTYNIQVGSAGSSNGLQGSWLFPVTMRTAPAVAYKDTVGNASAVSINNGTVNNNQTFGAGNIYAQSSQGFFIDAAWSFSSTPYGQWCKFQAAFNAELG